MGDAMELFLKRQPSKEGATLGELFIDGKLGYVFPCYIFAYPINA